jgi:hypothetical protein
VDWQLWIDYHRTDAEGLTHGNLRNAAPGTKLVVDEYIVVGNEEADPAAAEVVQVGPIPSTFHDVGWKDPADKAEWGTTSMIVKICQCPPVVGKLVQARQLGR